VKIIDSFAYRLHSDLPSFDLTRHSSSMRLPTGKLAPRWTDHRPTSHEELDWFEEHSACKLLFVLP
jgi:hypothetical protein